MKNLITTILIFSSILTLTAQVDLGTSPISTIIFGRLNVGAEVAVTNNIGLQGSLLYSTGNILGNTDDEYKGIGYEAFLKYYMLDDADNDKFFIGIYSRNIGTSNRNAFRYGFNMGYKVVSKQNVFFEMNSGLGLAIIKEYNTPALNTSIDTDNLTLPDFYIKASVGYRIGSKNI